VRIQYRMSGSQRPRVWPRPTHKLPPLPRKRGASGLPGVSLDERVNTDGVGGNWRGKGVRMIGSIPQRVGIMWCVFSVTLATLSPSRRERTYQDQPWHQFQQPCTQSSLLVVLWTLPQHRLPLLLHLSSSHTGDMYQTRRSLLYPSYSSSCTCRVREEPIVRVPDSDSTSDKGDIWDIHVAAARSPLFSRFSLNL
jgi:hypothetical protein